MRNSLVLLVNMVFVAALSAAAGNAAPTTTANANAAHAPASILKRAAVPNPELVDFQEDVPIVAGDELNAAAAGMANPVSGGSEMDQEIDTILNKVTKTPAAKPGKASAPARVPATVLPKNNFAPAKPQAPKQTTQKPPAQAPVEVAPPTKGPAVPDGQSGSLWTPGTPNTGLLAGSLPQTFKMSPDAYAALRDVLFPAPLWRRQVSQENANKPPVPKLPRGI